MKTQTIRLSDAELSALRTHAAEQRCTISESVRTLIRTALCVKTDELPELKSRVEQIEKRTSEQPADAQNQPTDQAEKLQSLEAELVKHRQVFAQLLTVTLLILPTDKKQFCRDAAAILSLKL